MDGIFCLFTNLVLKKETKFNIYEKFHQSRVENSDWAKNFCDYWQVVEEDNLKRKGEKGFPLSINPLLLLLFTTLLISGPFPLTHTCVSTWKVFNFSYMKTLPVITTFQLFMSATIQNPCQNFTCLAGHLSSHSQIFISHPINRHQPNCNFPLKCLQFDA